MGISGRSSADVELRSLLLFISSEGIVAIVEPVAIIAFSKLLSMVFPSAVSIFKVEEFLKEAVPWMKLIFFALRS